MEQQDGEQAGAKYFYGVVPVFLVDDLVATVEYYRDVLGFEVDFLYGEPARQGSVSRGNVVFNFLLSEPRGRRNSVHRAGPGNGFDAYIVVTDIDDLYEELYEHGAQIRTSPSSLAHGMREFRIEDCNGYMITFGQEIEA
jgi:uncharacterized glyoxalase superfamily protein PhnB